MINSTGDPMPTNPRISKILAPIAVALCLIFPAGAFGQSDQTAILQSPNGGEIRALVIGIDAYQHVRELKGATADAQDISTSLKTAGVHDVTTLLDDAADRNAVLSAIYGLLQRTGPRDLVMITLAGHGAQEPEQQGQGRVENVFLLAGFQDGIEGSQQRILGAEFNHFIKQFEDKGAQVLFVADTCYGGGMTRSIDPRADFMSFRHVPSYRLADDALKPVATVRDESATPFDFKRTIFLAAVDNKTMAPEVEIPGIPGLRGALSYALAREIEGTPNTRGDDRTTVRDLFGSVRQVVYQLSDQRQNIVATASPDESPSTVVFERVRSVKLASASPAAPAPAGPQLAADDRPVKIASSDGNDGALSHLKPHLAQFKIVKPLDYPDLTWDPDSHDVLAWGDVVAYAVEPRDLPNIIDRTKAVRDLKMMADKTPQPIKVSPDDSRHHNSAVVHIEVSDVVGRALILFDITGDGSVELLYPVGADPHVIGSPDYLFPVRVQKPFGSDQLVAVTSGQPMPELEQALHKLDNRKAAVELVNILKRYAPADARIGSAGLFTAP